MIAYRIFECKDNKPHTLFHGYEGSRSLPLNKWLKAINKPVTNPGGGKVFTSGFHVCLSCDDILSYIKRFTSNRKYVICKVKVKQTRPKPGSKVTLADKMYIDSTDWEKAYAYSTM